MDLLRAGGSTDIKHGLWRQTLPLDVHTQPRLKAGEGSIFQGEAGKPHPAWPLRCPRAGSCLAASLQASFLPAALPPNLSQNRPLSGDRAWLWSVWPEGCMGEGVKDTW